jgi:hypothetical protein
MELQNIMSRNIWNCLVVTWDHTLSGPRNPGASQQTPHCGLVCYREKIQSKIKYLEIQTFILLVKINFIELYP